MQQHMQQPMHQPMQPMHAFPGAGFGQPAPVQNGGAGGFANVVLNAQAAAMGAMGAATKQAVLTGAPHGPGVPTSVAGHAPLAMPSHASPVAPATASVGHTEHDFGDFQSQPAEPSPASKGTPNKNTAKWASLGGLVDLNSLGADVDSKQSAAASETPKYDDHSSFHGLDGFSRGPAPGTTGRPMGGSSATAMAGMQRPMGTGMQQTTMAHTGMGMGMGMGAGMGMGQPMMGGGMMQPATTMGMGMGMGQPSGMQGGMGMQQPMGIGMGMQGGMQPMGMGMGGMGGMQSMGGMAQPAAGMGMGMGSGVPQGGMGMGMGGAGYGMAPQGAYHRVACRVRACG